jgi:signal transduction histidine kinase
MQAPVVVVEAGASFALAAALIAYVLGHRPPGVLHRTVIAILGTILLWNAGILLRLGGAGDALTEVAFGIQYVGVYALPPLFLYLAARCARIPIAEERSGAALSALLVPSLLGYLCLLTNSLHGLFSTLPLSDAAFGLPREWGGPFFWLAAAWAYLCALGGILLCLHAAWRTADPLDRKRLLVLAPAAGAPLFANAVFLLGWVPFTPLPAALAVTGLLLVVAILRYRFLEFAPLPARDVIARLREGLVLTNAAGQVTDANPAAEALLGRTVGELRGEGLEALASGLDGSGELARVLEGCPEDAPVVREIEIPDGRAIEISAGWMRGRGRSPVGRFLVINDRTEQRRHEQLRHQAQRLASVGALAAGLAHEINNPLAYVRASLAQLHRIADAVDACSDRIEAKEAEQLAEMRELVEDSLEGVARISSIVESTRRLSRDPHDRRNGVDLNAIAEDALRFASFHENHSVGVETALARDLPAVEGSPDRLGQAVLNLLINAKQVLGDRRDGRILVETLSGDRFVELRVHDDGPGVAPELRERIFDPFFTTKGPDEGTGLGLAIAYDIVMAHDGFIEVVGSPLGGACFRLRLPATTSRRDLLRNAG